MRVKTESRLPELPHPPIARGDQDLVTRRNLHSDFVFVMLSNLAIFPREKKPVHCLSDIKKMLKMTGLGSPGELSLFIVFCDQ